MENQGERERVQETCFHSSPRGSFADYGSPRGTCSFADYWYTGSPLAGLGMHAERVKKSDPTGCVVTVVLC